MGIGTILILDPDGNHYRYSGGALKELTETSFDMAGSACRFDLEEIKKLLD